MWLFVLVMSRAKKRQLYFAKSFIIDVWQDPKYASAY